MISSPGIRDKTCLKNYTKTSRLSPDLRELGGGIVGIDIVPECVPIAPIPIATSVFFAASKMLISCVHSGSVQWLECRTLNAWGLNASDSSKVGTSFPCWEGGGVTRQTRST